MVKKAQKDKKPKVLGIITARGGSKSIPRKNIKIFAGKPLIVWSIEAGIASEILDRLIVSTEDEEIADISKKAGVEIPFMRPFELAQDDTSSLSVLQHAVSMLKEKDGYWPDYVMLLEPTSPGRQPFHIKEAIELVLESGADAVVSVAEVPGHYNPLWQFRLKDDNEMELFTGGSIKNIVGRRQELPKTYFRNGSFYLFRPEALFAEEPSLYGEKVLAYPMDEKYSIDIDTPDDWDRGEIRLEKIIKELGKDD
ncbi:MAG: acylneuraminate cytidylyltransferase family protein [bacterium]|nr:acylneuraminate cytidylyltransferase family protein [bacterium]